MEGLEISISADYGIFSSGKMNIQYLKHDEINKLKWDRCISLSFNGIVYAYSWYLDIVSYQWDALVYNDYKAVMPITTKSNYAMSKIIQPEYAPQLGVFTSELLDVDVVNAFLDAIPDRFKSVHIHLNPFNKVTHQKYHVKQGVTYELDLIMPYKVLYSNFSKDAQQYIDASKNNRVNIMRQLNLKEFLLLKKTSTVNQLTFEHLNILRRIIPFCTNHNIGETYGAYNDKNQLVAGAFFIKSHQKVICLLAACSDEGKSVRADYALFDYYVRENSEKNITLDFGNYEIEELVNIGKAFNATPVNYYKLKRTRFLWFFRFKW